MRLWHKDLIPVLPRQQLLGQWRECGAIARNISESGTPNHILVNKIMDYPLGHFYWYSRIVCDEMEERGFNPNWEKFRDYPIFQHKVFIMISYGEIFKAWHNKRYLLQCYSNLEEKYDCGGIPKKDWQEIVNKVYSLQAIF